MPRHPESSSTSGPAPSDLPAGQVSSHGPMEPAPASPASQASPARAGMAAAPVAGQQAQVVVTGFVAQAPAAEPQAKDVTVPGGRYIIGGRFDPEQKKHLGGQVVDANNKVLATFADDAENTGDPQDGEKPE
jgi:hypothetical protein